jgi:serine protease
MAVPNACPASTPSKTLLRCYDDSDTDTGHTSTAEIIYSDFYVPSDNPGKLIVDVLTYASITDSSWLTNSSNTVNAVFDTNGDGAIDVQIVPRRVSITANTSIAGIIMDKSGSGWVQRGLPGECNASLKWVSPGSSGTHFSTLDNGTWWQYSVDSSCLFGSRYSAISVDGAAFAANAITPSGDFSPAWPASPINLTSVPTISSVSPNTGSVSGGTTVTITGTNLGGITSVSFGSNVGTIISASSSTLVVRTPAYSEPSVANSPTESKFVDSTLWGLKGSYGTRSSGAWNRTQGASNIIVAIVDTGITAHPDLGAQVAGYDMISSDSPWTSYVANDGDGRDSDPSDPGDWISVSESNGTVASGFFAGCPVEDSSWHGTHVAGTVNALINGTGSVGVAPNVKVEPVRVLGKCGGFTSDIAAGILWAAGGTVWGVPVNANPANIISLSLGGSGACSAATQEAIDFAYNKGITVTVAAGNDGEDAFFHQPANCNHIITVAATGRAGQRASFSNYGPLVEIAAPGVDIYSTLNSGTQGPVAPTYASYNGTSMATPHVAGIVALMLSREPNLTPDQVLTRLQSTATGFNGGACDLAAVTKTCGAGIANADAAVR